MTRRTRGGWEGGLAVQKWPWSPSLNGCVDAHRRQTERPPITPLVTEGRHRGPPTRARRCRVGGNRGRGLVGGGKSRRRKHRGASPSRRSAHARVRDWVAVVTPAPSLPPRMMAARGRLRPRWGRGARAPAKNKRRYRQCMRGRQWRRAGKGEPSTLTADVAGGRRVFFVLVSAAERPASRRHRHPLPPRARVTAAKRIQGVPSGDTASSLSTMRTSSVPPHRRTARTPLPSPHPVCSGPEHPSTAAVATVGPPGPITMIGSRAVPAWYTPVGRTAGAQPTGLAARSHLAGLQAVVGRAPPPGRGADAPDVPNSDSSA